MLLVIYRLVFGNIANALLMISLSVFTPCSLDASIGSVASFLADDNAGAFLQPDGKINDKKAEQYLTKSYKECLAKATGQKQEQIRIAQRAWIKFSDATETANKALGKQDAVLWDLEARECIGRGNQLEHFWDTPSGPVEMIRTEYTQTERELASVYDKIIASIPEPHRSNLIQTEKTWIDYKEKNRNANAVLIPAAQGILTSIRVNNRRIEELQAIYQSVANDHKPSAASSHETEGEPQGSDRSADCSYSADAVDIDAITATTPQLKGELFPETRKRFMEQADIQNWSDAKLQYAINEMYARRDANFGNKKVKKFFLAFDWYMPIAEASLEMVEQHFSLIETSNLKLLDEARKSKAGDSTPSNEVTPEQTPESTPVEQPHEEEVQRAKKQFRSSSETLVITGAWVLKMNDGTTQFSLGLKNNGAKSIRAFRADLFKVNDFNENDKVVTIEYSSASEYHSFKGEIETGHLVGPGETVYYNAIIFTDARPQLYYSAVSYFQSLIASRVKSEKEAKETEKSMLVAFPQFLQVSALVTD